MSTSNIESSADSIECESEKEEEEDFELPDYIDNSLLDMPTPVDDTATYGILSRSSSSEPGWTTDEPPETGAEDNTGSSVTGLSDNETQMTKKRKCYSTGDREIVGQGRSAVSPPSDDNEDEAGTGNSNSGRPVRSTQNKNPHQFARVRRQYNRHK